MATLPADLVETAWLAEHLDDPRLRIVDLRWRGDGSGRQFYQQGHIPGAVHLDWHSDLNGGSADDLLLPPDRIRSADDRQWHRRQHGGGGLRRHRPQRRGPALVDVALSRARTGSRVERRHRQVGRRGSARFRLL